MFLATIFFYVSFASLETSVSGGTLKWIDRSHTFADSTCRYAHHWGVCRVASQCLRPTKVVCWNETELVVCCLDHIDPNEMEYSFPGCGRRKLPAEEIENDKKSKIEANPNGRQMFSYRRWSQNVYEGGDSEKKSHASEINMPLDDSDTKKSDEKHPWPWMVTIYIKSKRVHMCGGSLISLRYVLSAAHCSYVEGKVDPSTYTVVLGSNSRLNGTIHKVQSVTLHPKFTYVQAYNDVSLIKLQKEVTLGPKVYPVCLPTRRLLARIQPDQVQVTVTGWGKTSEKKFYPKEVQEVNIALLQQRDCEAVSKAVPYSLLPEGITDVFLCAGDKVRGNDTCTGDSGGPLVMKLASSTWVQLGIVSFGFGCELPDYPGVYTRVSHFIEWIYANSDLYQHHHFL